MTEQQTTSTAGTFTQEQVNSIVANAKREVEAKFADYADLKKRAEDAEAAAEAQKTELQKLQGSVDQLANDLKDERLAGIKKDVATAAKLTPAQAAYLKGSTIEELTASAAQLQADFGIKVDESTGGDGDGGQTTDDGGQQTSTTTTTPPATRRPVDTLTGGGTTVSTSAPDESDPAKLADMIGRR